MDDNGRKQDPGADGALEALVARLEQILRRLVAHFERLEALALERRAAMRAADTAALGACIARENEVVQQVADVEKQRLAVVGECASRLSSPARHQTAITWIAQRTGGEAGRRLLSLAQTLREVVGRVNRENAAAAAAAEMLSGHMEGLMRQVIAKLNHAQTYGRGGRVEAGPRVLSAVDLRS